MIMGKLSRTGKLGAVTAGLLLAFGTLVTPPAIAAAGPGMTSGDLVTVDLSELPGGNCWYEVKHVTDAGDRFAHAEPMCPAPGPDATSVAGLATVDMTRLPASSCWYEIKSLPMGDDPTGDRFVHVETLCP